MHFSAFQRIDFYQRASIFVSHGKLLQMMVVQSDVSVVRIWTRRVPPQPRLRSLSEPTTSSLFETFFNILNQYGASTHNGTKLSLESLSISMGQRKY